MWQRFTERARKVVFYAQEEAQRFGEGYVSTEHLLLGLVREDDSVAARVFEKLGISLNRVRAEVEKQLPRGEARPSQDMTLTPRAKRVIDLSYDEARNLNNNYIGTEHLLLGLIREADGLAGRVLAKLGAELEKSRQLVVEIQDQGGQEGPSVHREPIIRRVTANDPWHAYTASAKAAIQGSFDEKRKYGHDKVSAEHLLLAVFSDPETPAARVLIEMGVTEERLRERLQVEFERAEPPTENGE